MSGAYNQNHELDRLKRLGYREVETRKRGSLAKFNGRKVVIVSKESKKDGKKANRTLYLSPQVLEALRNPDRVIPVVLGDTVILVASADSRGLKVSHPHGNSYPKISITSLCNEIDLKPGGYHCFTNGESVGFNSKDEPERY
jgi:hypothetical protein